MAVTSNGTPALVSTAGSNAPTTVGTFPTGASPLVNHLIVCVVTMYGSTSATSVSQNGGSGTYVNPVTITGTNCLTSIWTKTATGSDTAPSFLGAGTGTAGDADMTVTVYDLSDPDGNTPVLDTSGTATGTTTLPAVTTTGNVSIAGELAIAAATVGQGTTAATAAWTTPTNWTLAQAGNAQTASSQSQTANYFTTSGTVLAAGSTATVTIAKPRTTTTHTSVLIAVFKSVFTAGPALNQPLSQPAGFRTILARVGLAMASVIPVAAAAPPPPPASGPPVPALTQPVSIHRTLPPRGTAHKRSGQGITLTPGPPVKPLSQPVAARTRPLPPRGVAHKRSGQGIPQTQGVPAPPLHQPAAARTRPLPPRGTTHKRTGQGIPQTAGPLLYPQRYPVTVHRVSPPRGRAYGISAGAPVRNPVTPAVIPPPLRQPVRARQFPGRPGSTLSNVPIGVFPVPGIGVPFPPLTQPVTIRRTLPARGRTAGNAGAPVRNPVITTGAVFSPLRAPVQARRPLPRPGYAAAVVLAGSFSNLTSGPPVTPLRQPVSIRRVLPPRGRTAGNKGAPVPIPVTTGPPVTPLRQPVRAKLPYVPPGRHAGSPGVPLPSVGVPFPPLTQPAGLRVTYLQIGQSQTSGASPVVNPPPPATGAVFPPLRQPVAAKRPLPAPGRAAAVVVAGFFTLPTSGPPFPPLRQPVSTRRVPPARGRVSGNAGAPVQNPVPPQTGAPFRPARPVTGIRPPVMQGRAAAVIVIFVPPVPVTSGPPLTPLRQPVSIRRALPARGRTAGNAGAPVHNPPPPVTGSAFPPLRSPVTGRVPLFLRGRAMADVPVFIPPVPVTAGVPFPPLAGPVRTRITLPPRGRVQGNQGAPVRNPSIPARVYPLRGPVCPVRPPAALNGRAMAVVALPAPHNPNIGAAFPARHAPVSIRFTLPPRGHNSGNQGSPVNNPPQTLLFRLGSPYFQWDTGTPGLVSEWATGSPVFAWMTGVPETSA